MCRPTTHRHDITSDKVVKEQLRLQTSGCCFARGLKATTKSRMFVDIKSDFFTKLQLH